MRVRPRRFHFGSGGSVDIYLLLNGTSPANLCDTGGRVATLKVIGGGTFGDNSGACQFHLPNTPLGTYLPSDGKWVGYQLSFNVPTGLAGNLGVGFGLNFRRRRSAGQRRRRAVDVPGVNVAQGPVPAPVPEPASLGLMAIGLLGLGAKLRARRRQDRGDFFRSASRE
jgi:hypothetical protein